MAADLSFARESLVVLRWVVGDISGASLVRRLGQKPSEPAELHRIARDHYFPGLTALATLEQLQIVS
jgi:hypothetical protein